MREEVVQRLLALNRAFYDRLAGPFALSRAHPQPGFYRLLELLPVPCRRLLDVGCGEGRFGRFLLGHAAVERYTGIDSSSPLLEYAAQSFEAEFLLRDISQPQWSSGLGRFDAIACLAVLQHIPGKSNRVRLLAEMGALLAPGARLFFSTWQFRDKARFRNKFRDWEDAGLVSADVEPNDFLLPWERDGFALRYVTMIDESEAAILAAEAGLRITEHFRCDGKEGDLNLYSVLEAAGQ